MAPKTDNYEHNLYYAQHKWLPHFFYGATAPLMREIQKQKGQLFVDLFHAMHEDEPDYHCPITTSDFDVTSCINGDHNILQIIMPEPLGNMYCRSVYLCHNTTTKSKTYFTVEQTSSGEYYICSWLENGAHVIYEEAPNSIYDELVYIQHYFLSEFHLEDVIAVTIPQNLKH